MSDYYMRIKDKATGHERTIPARRFNAETMTKLDKPALGRDGLPAAPKFKTTASKEAAKKSGTSPAKSGHQAETKKEND